MYICVNFGASAKVFDRAGPVGPGLSIYFRSLTFWHINQTFSLVGKEPLPIVWTCKRFHFYLSHVLIS